MKPRPIAILCAIGISVAVLHALSQSAERPEDPPLRLLSVHVKGDKWYTLADLETQARSVLKARTEFDDRSRNTMVWVDPGSKEQLIKFTFASNFGDPFWSVSFGSSGRPTLYEYGELREKGAGGTNTYHRVEIKEPAK